MGEAYFFAPLVVLIIAVLFATLMTQSSWAWEKYEHGSEIYEIHDKAS